MRLPLISLGVAGILSAGCTAESPVMPGALTSIDVLAAALRAEGASVAVQGPVARKSYPFFSIAGVRLVVSGESITAFPYPTVTEAEASAASISRDGAVVGTSNIFWVAPPRFYRTDAVIVLYVGTDPGVIGILDRALGPPFASR